MEPASSDEASPEAGDTAPAEPLPTKEPASSAEKPLPEV
jgi:hypothetical protein